VKKKDSSKKLIGYINVMREELFEAYIWNKGVIRW
jgi:hypothetical protein